MSTPVFLGIDLGTSRLKLLAIDPGGRQVAEATWPIEMSIPRPGWAEQDPEDWWVALATACKALLREGNIAPSSIEAIGLSGQMHGATFLDAGGDVLRPCLIWADGRTAEQVEQIRSLVPPSDLLRITGNAANTGFTAPRVLWVRQHESARLR